MGTSAVFTSICENLEHVVDICFGSLVIWLVMVMMIVVLVAGLVTISDRRCSLFSPRDRLAEEPLESH